MLKGQAYCQTFSIRINTFALIYVKQLEVLQGIIGRPCNAAPERRCRSGLINNSVDKIVTSLEAQFGASLRN